MQSLLNTIRHVIAKKPIDSSRIESLSAEAIGDLKEYNRSAVAWALRIPILAAVSVGGWAVVNKPTQEQEYAKYSALVENDSSNTGVPVDDRTKYIALMRIIDAHATPEREYNAMLDLAELANSQDAYVKSMNPQIESERLLAKLAPYTSTQKGYPAADLLMATRNLHTLETLEQAPVEQQLYIANRAKIHLHRAWRTMNAEQRTEYNVVQSLVETIQFLCMNHELQHEYKISEDLILELVAINPHAVPSIVSTLKHTPPDTWKKQLLHEIEQVFKEQETDRYSVPNMQTLVKTHLAFADWKEACSIFEVRATTHRYGLNDEERQEYAKQLQKELLAFYTETASLAPFDEYINAIKRSKSLSDSQKLLLLQRKIGMLPEVQNDVVLAQAAGQSIVQDNHEPLQQWVLDQLQQSPQQVVSVYRTLCAVQKQDILRPVKVRSGTKPIEQLAVMYAWDTEYKKQVARKEFEKAQAVLLEHNTSELAQQRRIEFYNTHVLQASAKELSVVLQKDTNLTAAQRSIVLSQWLVTNQHVAATKTIAAAIAKAKANPDTTTFELYTLEANFIKSIVQAAQAEGAKALPDATVSALLAKVHVLQTQLPHAPALRELETDLRYLQQKK